MPSPSTSPTTSKKEVSVIYPDCHQRVELAASSLKEAKSVIHETFGEQVQLYRCKSDAPHFALLTDSVWEGVIESEVFYAFPFGTSPNATPAPMSPHSQSYASPSPPPSSATLSGGWASTMNSPSTSASTMYGQASDESLRSKYSGHLRYSPSSTFSGGYHAPSPLYQSFEALSSEQQYSSLSATPSSESWSSSTTPPMPPPVYPSERTLSQNVMYQPTPPHSPTYPSTSNEYFLPYTPPMTPPDSRRPSVVAIGSTEQNPFATHHHMQGHAAYWSPTAPEPFPSVFQDEGYGTIMNEYGQEVDALPHSFDAVLSNPAPWDTKVMALEEMASNGGRDQEPQKRREWQPVFTTVHRVASEPQLVSTPAPTVTKSAPSAPSSPKTKRHSKSSRSLQVADNGKKSLSTSTSTLNKVPADEGVRVAVAAQVPSANQINFSTTMMDEKIPMAELEGKLRRMKTNGNLRKTASFASQPAMGRQAVAYSNMVPSESIRRKPSSEVLSKPSIIRVPSLHRKRSIVSPVNATSPPSWKN